MMVCKIEFYAYLPEISFSSFRIKVGSGFFSHLSRIRINGKKCWILIPPSLSIYLSFLSLAFSLIAHFLCLYLLLLYTRLELHCRSLPCTRSLILPISRLCCICYVLYFRLLGALWPELHRQLGRSADRSLPCRHRPAQHKAWAAGQDSNDSRGKERNG